MNAYLNRLEAAIDGSNASKTSSSFDNICAILFIQNQKKKISSFYFRLQ